MRAKPKRINQAKSLVAQPLFRSRQEKPKKGKGSYQRKASRNWEAFLLPLLHRCQLNRTGHLLQLRTDYLLNPRLFLGAYRPLHLPLSPQPIKVSAFVAKGLKPSCLEFVKSPARGR